MMGMTCSRRQPSFLSHIRNPRGPLQGAHVQGSPHRTCAPSAGDTLASPHIFVGLPKAMPGIWEKDQPFPAAPHRHQPTSPEVSVPFQPGPGRQRATAGPHHAIQCCLASSHQPGALGPQLRPAAPSPSSPLPSGIPSCPATKLAAAPEHPSPTSPRLPLAPALAGVSSPERNPVLA